MYFLPHWTTFFPPPYSCKYGFCLMASTNGSGIENRYDLKIQPSWKLYLTLCSKVILLGSHAPLKNLVLPWLGCVVILSYSSNWITLLLLGTSAPSVLCCDRFKTGKAWSGRPGNGVLWHYTTQAIFLNRTVNNTFISVNAPVGRGHTVQGCVPCHLQKDITFRSTAVSPNDPSLHFNTRWPLDLILFSILSKNTDIAHIKIQLF